MVVLFLNPVVNLDEKFIIWKECSCDHWFIKTGDTLGFLIKSSYIAYIQRVNFFAIIIDYIKEENTIVLVGNSKYDSLIVLFDLAHLQIYAIILNSKHFFIVFESICYDFKVLCWIANDWD